MSGTLFIVCIPMEDKDEALRDLKNNESRKLFNGHGSTEGLSLEKKEVCVEIGDFDWDAERSPRLQTTKSCNNIPSIILSVEDEHLRKSLDENRSSCEKTNKKLNDLNELQLNILPDSPMDLILNKILQKCKIENAIWNQNNEMYSVTFSMPSGDLHEQVLKLFKCWGIGERPGSSVTMLPCTVILPTKPNKKDDNGTVFQQGLFAKDQGLWDKFVNSVNARMNVAKIVEELRQDAALTFDFVILIIIAAIMAAFGLIENSIICLTSSMLISPLMGPLIAATFSTVIKDKQLMKFGVINELIGICLATLVGFVFGLIVGCVDERYGVGDGLGVEILSRCEIHSLVIGVFTAIPSGAAVAIAILGEKIGSLVGVAISASLLPPAVNAGLLWALALLFMIHKNDVDIYNSVIKTTVYSQNQAVELAILGTISMAVTVINIICIYGTGILFLKIKEVAPISSKFWKHDVKVARDYNNTIGTAEGASLKNRLIAELAQFEGNEFNTMTANRFSYQNTWSPMMTDNRTTRVSMHELEKLYWEKSLNETGSCPKKRRVTDIYKSISPSKYQLLKNDWSSSPTVSTVQVISQSKVETPRRRADKDVQSKSKFTVTRADDPLDLNKKL